MIESKDRIHTQRIEIGLSITENICDFQVNRKLIENDIIPIFAVGERVLNLYKQISDHLTQLSSVGEFNFVHYLKIY